MIQGVTLLAALALGLTGIAAAVPVLPSILLAGSLATLVWSFGRDVVWQLRRSGGGVDRAQGLVP